MERRFAKALVLGSPSIAALIAEQLEVAGYHAVILEQCLREPESGIRGAVLPPLPVPSDPDAIPKLHEVLRRFLDIAGPPAASHSHCLHPGNSLWADRPELAQVAQELGFFVVCPPVKVMSLFGNKLNLLTEAERLGIPNLVLSFDPISSIREIETLCDRAPGHFPFVIKSVRGGGGFGLHVVHQPGDFERKLPLWLEQLRRNLGEVLLFTERYLEGARHIVVPFARFRDGRTHVFPLTDASLQCRYRKIIQFCPADGSPEVTDRLIEWTLRLAEHFSYVGVGAFEFLVDSSRAFLLEGVARLPTDFRLWEKVGGTRAVAWQLAALQGGDPPEVTASQIASERSWNCAISVRIYAEDPLLQLPQPGYVHEISERRSWSFAGEGGGMSAGAELFLSLSAGRFIDPESDGLAGLLIAGGRDRSQAMLMARGALEEFWIAGSLQTNQRFVVELLSHDWIREGVFHAGFVDEEFVPEIRPSSEWMRVFASVCGMLASRPRSLTDGDPASSRWAVGDQWVRPDSGQLSWVEPPSFWEHRGLPGVSGVLDMPDAVRARVSACPLSPRRWQVRIGGWVMTVRQVLGASASRKARTRPLIALVPGRVHSILFRENSRVPAHEPAIIIESLHMLVPHAFPTDARIVAWKVTADQKVDAGQVMAEIQNENSH